MKVYDALYYNSVIITHLKQFKDMFSYNEYNVVK